MKLSEKTFYDKVLGCWMGKNIGGTLGTPVEWFRQLNDIHFYTHDLNGDPLPNDDLDLQLIWLKCVEDQGIKITARDLAEYWLDYQVANYSEYGIGKANLKAGIMPPMSGTWGNEYKDSCGAYIRSEIWACMCPGRPDLAVQYAYEDAIVDHGNGEGTYAALFSAAMESAAFVISDYKKLVEIGLSYIPKDCGVAKAIATAYDCYEKGMDWVECRDTILDLHGGRMMYEDMCSERDYEKDLHRGKRGYDVPSNIAIIVAGILYGEDDFEKTICTIVNMGEDTDCTAGTFGAIYGIINGYSKIPKKWIDPIGHNIVTVCCNNAHSPKFPKTVEELTERTIIQSKIVSLYYNGKDGKKTVDIFGDSDDISDLDEKSLYFNPEHIFNDYEIMMSMNGPRYDCPLFSACLDYEKNCLLSMDDNVKIKLLIGLKVINEPMNLKVEWLSNDLCVEPQECVMIPVWQKSFKKYETAEFTVSPFVLKHIYEGTVKITVMGRPTVMHIPVILESYKRENASDKYYKDKPNVK